MDGGSLAARIAGWALDVLAASATEVVGVAGVFFLFGVALFWLERRTFSVMAQGFGYRTVIYVTGWIGTAAHELGHALMCLAFGHRITAISLFSPDLQSGVLGYVNHAYDRDSLYQRAGLFFIGVAPILTGGSPIIGMAHLLIPGFGGVVSKVAHLSAEEGAYGFSQYVGGIWAATSEALKVIFRPGNLTRWQFWAFLYVSTCISSHLAPSSKDMQSAWFGFGVILGLVLLANGIAIALGGDPVSYVLGANRYLGVVAAVLSMAMLLSTLNFLASYLVASLWYWLRWRTLLSPM